MRGVNMMMVMLRGLAVHVGWQYINGQGIWQAQNWRGFRRRRKNRQATLRRLLGFL
ncbi:MAG: hypothetical protein LC108_12215 [Anaerolineales bacterium]|nr:hypothetical protein [Anaerolineales bacterium]